MAEIKTADNVQQRGFREILLSVPDRGGTLRGVCSVILQAQQRILQHFLQVVQGYTQKIVEVSVDGLPSEASYPSSRSPEAAPPKPQGVLRIMVDIAMCNGLRLSQKNLIYRELLRQET